MSLAPHRPHIASLAPPPRRLVAATSLQPAVETPAREVPRVTPRLPRGHHRIGRAVVSAGVPVSVAAGVWTSADNAGAALLLGHVLLWPLMLRSVGETHLLRSTVSVTTVAAAAGRALLLLAAVAWATGSEVPPALLVLVVAGTALLDLALRALPQRGAAGRDAVRRVLLAGHDDAAERMTGELERVLGTRVTVVGRCRSTVDDVAAAAGRTEADDVVLLPCSHLSPGQMRHLAWRLADQGRSLHVAPGLVDVGGARTHFATHGGLSLVNLQHSELRSVRRTVLQLGGRAAAGLLLLLLAPLLALLAVAVRLDSAGPAFFRQERVGERDRRFTMLKFRTMTCEPIDVECPEGQFLFKLQRDPRVTKVGRMLRRYSLDELPQLVNVLRGEMALVGPRPALPEETARYPLDVHRRLAVRPGMTGLWQVSGRSDLSWEDTVRLDLDYVDNWTPGLDLRILLRTAGAVLGHRGAY